MSAASAEEAQRDIHTAITKHLDEGEIAVGWCLTIDVAGPDNVRYLAHRAGGGHDGTDAPMVWTARGMLEGSVDVAADQMHHSTVDPDEEEEEDPTDARES